MQIQACDLVKLHIIREIEAGNEIIIFMIGDATTIRPGLQKSCLDGRPTSRKGAWVGSMQLDPRGARGGVAHRGTVKANKKGAAYGPSEGGAETQFPKRQGKSGQRQVKA